MNIGHEGTPKSYEEEIDAYRRVENYIKPLEKEFEEKEGYAHINFNVDPTSERRLTISFKDADVFEFINRLKALQG